MVNVSLLDQESMQLVDSEPGNWLEDIPNNERVLNIDDQVISVVVIAFVPFDEA